MTLFKSLVSASVLACLISTSVAAEEINLFLIPSPSSTAIQSFIPEFERKTGITVNVTEVPYGEAHQKLLLSVQLHQGQYDIAQFDNSFLAAFGAAGVMAPLDDHLATSSVYDIGDFAVGQQDYGKYDGKTLGLTLSTEPMIQWYRTDIYAELGLKPATTWAEFESNAKAVKEAGKGDGAMFGWGPNASWWWMTLVWSFGGHLYDEQLRPTVNTAEAVTATRYFKEMLAYGPAGGISATGDDVANKFLSTNVGAMIQYSGYWGMALDPANSQHVGKIGTAKMPMGSVDVTHLAGWNIGIPSDARDPDAAWKFLEFVLGKPNARAYLLAGAAAIGRKSVTNDAELLAIHPYLPLLNIPASSRIERFPQLRVWPEMEKAILDALPPMLDGSTDIQGGLDALNEKLKPILAQEKAP
ncbi:ABC transporter substrate-binding protein [Mesorhizobium neociceri]|uniref:Sugar ABC transporter substrate-binding protein n=1 Tax=Mesorhizobium neociceri TaxID=1307853 RepID=A0A838B8M3_9HYPH|nr:sugar ABC transporter substrate-binding protein [Mesorhizobium neociceri]MBA1142319.1 sugar ABC transporter substrate-binding protein [Mesorhizobium neociceri]